MTSRTIRVGGMACEGCEQRVRSALEALDGVERALADHEADRVEVAFDASLVAPDDLADAIEAVGYEPRG
ncbi:MAG: heavy-metal-associated domain-containing protein [Halobacteriales archaeon]